jgi:AcrR family transcriptional regulator
VKVSRAGRRPGNPDTRARILDAARTAFLRDGYTGASVRRIAGDAGVDPALVYHYFPDKSDLFVETMHLPVDPRQVKVRAAEGAAVDGVHDGDGRVLDGAKVVEGFLAQWETDGDGKGSPSFIAMVQAMASSTETADAMREFLLDRLAMPPLPGEDDAQQARRQCLMTSQLMGLGWARYVMRFEPIASAPRAEVARWVGPTLERYARGELPGSESPSS